LKSMECEKMHEIVRLKVSAADTIKFAGSSYLNTNGGWIYKCVDCGSLVRLMDRDDHCCYCSD
jgi:hypothetical protein